MLNNVFERKSGFLFSKLKGFEFYNFQSILLMSEATCFMEIRAPLHKTYH